MLSLKTQKNYVRLVLSDYLYALYKIYVRKQDECAARWLVVRKISNIKIDLCFELYLQ